MRNMQEFGIQIEWTMTGHSRTATSRRKELCTWCCVCVVKCSWWNHLAGRWGVRHQWQRENQDPENQHDAQHEQVSVRVVLQSSQSVLCCHTHLLHIAHWLQMFECSSHSIPWSSPCMHELSVLSDFLDLFIIFTFFLSFIKILKQFLLPFNFTEVK